MSQFGLLDLLAAKLPRTSETIRLLARPPIATSTAICPRASIITFFTQSSSWARFGGVERAIEGYALDRPPTSIDGHASPLWPAKIRLVLAAARPPPSTLHPPPSRHTINSLSPPIMNYLTVNPPPLQGDEDALTSAAGLNFPFGIPFTNQSAFQSAFTPEGFSFESPFGLPSNSFNNTSSMNGSALAGPSSAPKAKPFSQNSVSGSAQYLNGLTNVIPSDT